MPLVSFREYARMQGVSLHAIQDRIKRGTITENAIVRNEGTRPKINSEIADADFAARRSEIGAQSDAMQRPHARKPIPPPANIIDEMFGPEPGTHGTPGTQSVLDKKLAPIPKPEVITKMIDGKEVPVTEIPYAGEDNFDRYRKAKAGSEEIKARLLELELEEAEGRLVDVKDVKKEIQNICTAIRESILNVPAKIAPELLSCTEIVEMETKLYKELNLALEGLSRLLNGRSDIK